MSSRTSMMILSPQSNHGAKIEDDQNATNQTTNETTTLVDTTTDSSYLGTTSLISMYYRLPNCSIVLNRSIYWDF